MRQLLGAVIVVVCVAVPLVESVDSWDHTLSDGNDTEADVVLAALCVGLSLSAAATILSVIDVRFLPIDTRFAPTPSMLLECPVERWNRPRPDSSPPGALRI